MGDIYTPELLHEVGHLESYIIGQIIFQYQSLPVVFCHLFSPLKMCPL